MTEQSKEYVSAGYCSIDNNKKGIIYYPVVNGKVVKDNEKAIVFDCKKHTDNPVGWIIGIKESAEGRYSGFNYIRHIEGNKEIIDRFKIQSVANAKAIDLENLRKRSKNISATIEEMTMGELKAWAKKSPTNKRALKFYLFEVF